MYDSFIMSLLNIDCMILHCLRVRCQVLLKTQSLLWRATAFLTRFTLPSKSWTALRSMSKCWLLPSSSHVGWDGSKLFQNVRGRPHVSWRTPTTSSQRERLPRLLVLGLSVRWHASCDYSQLELGTGVGQMRTNQQMPISPTEVLGWARRGAQAFMFPCTWNDCREGRKENRSRPESRLRKAVLSSPQLRQDICAVPI